MELGGVGGTGWGGGELGWNWEVLERTGRYGEPRSPLPLFFGGGSHPIPSLTGGVFCDSSLLRRSVKPCSKVFPPVTMTLP